MFPRDLGGRASTRSNAQPRSPSGGGASTKPSPGHPGVAAYLLTWSSALRIEGWVGLGAMLFCMGLACTQLNVPFSHGVEGLASSVFATQLL